MAHATAPRSRPSLPKPERAAFLEWPVPAELTTAPAVSYRNSFARALANLPPQRIATSYVYLTFEQMRALVDVAAEALGAKFAGVGLEAGAGCGLLASTVALSRDVQAVYALEVCRDMVEFVMPKIANAVLGENAHKVIGVHGSFDELRLPSESIDFIVEIDSLHHSDNLAVTLSECARVLRKGGQMMLLDRCHPDTLTDAEVESMLSQVYPESFLRKNHYPPGITLTRRENGEHEYRLFEWLAAFRQAGLEVLSARKLTQHIRTALAVKGMLSMLPRAATRDLYQTSNANLGTTCAWLKQRLLPSPRDPFFGRAVFAPKSTTAFLLGKV